MLLSIDFFFFVQVQSTFRNLNLALLVCISKCHIQRSLESSPAELRIAVVYMKHKANLYVKVSETCLQIPITYNHTPIEACTRRWAGKTSYVHLAPEHEYRANV